MIVRLLKRRGINRPRDPLREVQLEIQEVFRLDMIAAAFEGQQPILRVIVVLTQNPILWDVEYPLEDLGQPPVVYTCEHPAAHYARIYGDAIFQGKYEPLADRRNSFLNTDEGCFRFVWELYGNRGAEIWKKNVNVLYEDFFSFSSIVDINLTLGENFDDPEELELVIATFYWIVENRPRYSLLALPCLGSLTDMMFLKASILNGEPQAPYK